ncbi:Ribonuclease T2-like [Dillenia turbinata]|uniref:Ribonuclease T2-like n=1 Tax=Dillenia turbinata TaxID=194707 RepID=A0AAN8V7V9_9MAGN
MGRAKMLFLILIHMAIFTVNAKWKLAIQWRPTLCKNDKNANCQPPVLEKFTIHGLWNDTDCVGNNTLPDQLFQQIDSTLKLNVSWVHYENTSSANRKFWQYEWDKHGHCTKMPPIDYFRKAIDIYNYFPVLTYLQAKGIRPGLQFKVRDFHNAVLNQAGFTPNVVCHWKGEIDELQICFDTVGFIGLKAVNCPKTNLYEEKDILADLFATDNSGGDTLTGLPTAANDESLACACAQDSEESSKETSSNSLELTALRRDRNVRREKRRKRKGRDRFILKAKCPQTVPDLRDDLASRECSNFSTTTMSRISQLFNKTPLSFENWEPNFLALLNTPIDWKEDPQANVFMVDLPGLKKEDVRLK